MNSTNAKENRLNVNSKKALFVLIASGLILTIVSLALHQILPLRIIAFAFLLFIIFQLISYFELSQNLQQDIELKGEKIQKDIESKTKELEAMTQLLLAKNKELEKRNFELQKHELTALKIMEEMDISNWKLKRQSQVLEDAKTQLEKRTNDLSILYELSSSMGYITDFENLFLKIYIIYLHPALILLLLI